jgi:multimeric flavodoxin WrbA
MKALIDRAGFVGLANGRMYKNKIGASLACFRRSGGMHTIETMNHFFFGNELIIAGRSLSVARDKGEVEKDAEGVQNAQALGKKIAWLVKKLCC